MPARVDGENLIPTLLEAVGRGEDGALEQLVAAIYPDLKRLAHFHLARERPGHTLNTTEIVHEAFLRIASGEGVWNNRKHFLRAAAKVMRHLLVDHARKRKADKRDPGLPMLTWQDDMHAAQDEQLAVLALDAAIKHIGETDARLEQIIECRCFAGLTVQQTAEALGMSTRSVEREWHRARGYIAAALEPPDA